MKIILAILLLVTLVYGTFVNARIQRKKFQRAFSFFSLRHIVADLRSKDTYIFLALAVIAIVLAALIVEPWNQP